MKTKFKIVGLALTLVTVIWIYREYGRNDVQETIKMLPIRLKLDQGQGYELDEVRKEDSVDSQELNPFHSSMEARQNARKRLIEEYCKGLGTIPCQSRVMSM